MAAGVPCQSRRPSPAEGEEQRGGGKQAGQKHQNTEPSQLFEYPSEENVEMICISFGD